MVKKIGNPQGDALDILINAKLGDGGMYQSGVNYYMAFFSKSRDYLEFNKKKDGRKYPYLYIPVDTTKALIEDVFEFVEDNQLHSLYYKIGKSIPSTTIETDLKRMG